MINYQHLDREPHWFLLKLELFEEMLMKSYRWCYCLSQGSCFQKKIFLNYTLSTFLHPLCWGQPWRILFCCHGYKRALVLLLPALSSPRAQLLPGPSTLFTGVCLGKMVWKTGGSSVWFCTAQHPSKYFLEWLSENTKNNIIW